MAVDLGNVILVVSGLPRSGTSMMMKMLEAGGVELFTDAQRVPDVDNPGGYFEVELVKTLKSQQDKSWLRAAEGKAIKVVSSLLRDLPATHRYRVVFMLRHLDEVLASQNTMRERRGDATPAADQELKDLYSRHLQTVKTWLYRQPHFQVLELEYGASVAHPEECARQLQAFVGIPLDTARMADSVDTRLYRNRRDSSGAAPAAASGQEAASG